MRFRSLLIESPVKDNLKSLLTFFEPNSAEQNKAQQFYKGIIQIFNEIIVPNANNANIGQLSSYFANTARYSVARVLQDSLTDNGKAKYEKIAQNFNDMDYGLYVSPSIDRFLRTLRENLSHYYVNTPHQSIKNYIPAPDKNFSLMFEDLQRLEDRAIRDKDNTNQISHKGESGIAPIDLPDDFGKYAWYNLNKNYCDKEGAAMGHCGNRAAATERDTVLSFREHKGKDMYVPHLTFVLDTTSGMLGEMKGKANTKPNEKYHPAILSLLKNLDAIKGIEPKGYLPEENFNLITDVAEDNQTKQWLAENKPLMFGQDFSIMYELTKDKPEFKEQFYDSLITQFSEPGDQSVKIDEESGTIVLFRASDAGGLLDQISGYNYGESEWRSDLTDRPDYYNAMEEIKSRIRQYFEEQYDGFYKKEAVEEIDDFSYDNMLDLYLDNLEEEWLTKQLESALEDSFYDFAEQNVELQTTDTSEIERGTFRVFVKIANANAIIQQAQEDEFDNAREYLDHMFEGDILVSMEQNIDNVLGNLEISSLGAKTNDFEDVYLDPWLAKNHPKFKNQNESVNRLLTLAGIKENFKDGKNPQDKGDSARHGIPKNATISQLEKIRSSKSASPRKKQLAHWQINMRRGRKK